VDTHSSDVETSTLVSDDKTRRSGVQHGISTRQSLPRVEH
jgi:hypothetical protein